MTLALDPDEARRVARSGARAERLALHAEMRAAKADAIEGRRALAGELLDGPETISPQTGLGRASFSDAALVEAVRAEAYGLAAARGGDSHRDKGSVAYLLTGADFAPDSAAVTLARSADLLGPVCRYLGMLPILVKIEMTRASADKLLPRTTHMFHLDPADTLQVKAFMNLSQVDEDCGPFSALPADLSDTVTARLDYRGGRVADEEVAAITGLDRVDALTGPPGTTGFCDTNRCFHYGGRPAAAGKPKRDMLMFHYALPTSLLLSDETAGARRMRQLRPTADETWNALIGAVLT